MNKIMHGLSGFTVCKNALSLDYCIRECVESLLAVCEEVVIGEMGSTDGTLAVLAEWAAKEPRLRIVPIRDWTLERGNMHWFVSALNETRVQLKCAMALQLDADEVLSDDPRTRLAIEQTMMAGDAIGFDRINFVRDAHCVIPEGECCGRFVVRLGPSACHWVSDEPHARGEVPLLDMAHIEPGAKIFHLGFLRNREAFFSKAKVVLGAFFNDFDQRLQRAQLDGSHPFEQFPWWHRLTSYHGYYPAAVKAWLTERGYLV